MIKYRISYYDFFFADDWEVLGTFPVDEAWKKIRRFQKQAPKCKLRIEVITDAETENR